MNDLAEMEEQLRQLRPVQPSGNLMVRIEAGLGELPAQMIRPARFQMNWAYVGLGLAAAAAFLIFVRVNWMTLRWQKQQVATSTPAAALPAVPRSQFIPTDSTQVVYNVRDEGLVFPEGSAAPVRRVRSQTRESLQWRNPKTGASLVVTYPTEQIRLIPISGQ